MPDIYAETVRKLNDYITSRLTGSDDSCKRIFRDTNPSKFIIVGSLANIIEDSGVKNHQFKKTRLRSNIRQIISVQLIFIFFIQYMLRII